MHSKQIPDQVKGWIQPHFSKFKQMSYDTNANRPMRIVRPGNVDPPSRRPSRQDWRCFTFTTHLNNSPSNDIQTCIIVNSPVPRIQACSHETTMPVFVTSSTMSSSFQKSQHSLTPTSVSLTPTSVSATSKEPKKTNAASHTYKMFKTQIRKHHTSIWISSWCKLSLCDKSGNIALPFGLVHGANWVFVVTSAPPLFFCG